MNVVLAFVVAAMIRAQIRIAAAVIVGFVTLDVQDPRAMFGDAVKPRRGYVG